MKFSILSVATFFLAAATSVTSAPVEAVVKINQLDARQTSNTLIVSVYSNENFGGFKSDVLLTAGQCRSLPKGIRDNVESAQFPSGFRCTVFRQSDCQGSSDTNDSQKLVISDGSSETVVLPFVKKLRILVRNHARSVRCRPL